MHEEVEIFIEDAEDNQRQLLRALHQMITIYPEVVSKIRYKIPFYYRKSWICYLNPVKPDKVELAMLRGNELSGHGGILQANGRKQVSGIIYSQASDIDPQVVNSILQEAFLLDDKVKYASKRKKKH